MAGTLSIEVLQGAGLLLRPNLRSWCHTDNLCQPVAAQEPGAGGRDHFDD